MVLCLYKHREACPDLLTFFSGLQNEQPNVHVDETPWSVKGVKEWLWVAANKTFCLFHAADTRSRVELEQMLSSEYRGVLKHLDKNNYTQPRDKCK